MMSDCLSINSMLNLDMTSIILSGGKGSRFGSHKGLIKIGGIPIIERILKILNQFSKEIIIVTNEPLLYSYLEVRIVVDIIPFKGPLGGIYTGLFYTNFFPAFIVASDMPFISKEVVSYLISQWEENLDILIPADDKGYHPLFALYGKRCQDIFKQKLLKDNLSVHKAIKYLKKKVIPISVLNQIDPTGKSFFNLNTPEDLKIAELFEEEKYGIESKRIY